MTLFGNLAHHVDFEAVLAALEAVAGHRLEHPPRLVDAPAERHHDADVGQPHVVAHAPQRRAFQREAGSA